MQNKEKTSLFGKAFFNSRINAINALILRLMYSVYY